MTTEKLIKTLYEKARLGFNEGLMLEAADKLVKLKEDFVELTEESEDICRYCKYHIECRGVTE